jgi:hypothetical protein
VRKLQTPVVVLAAAMVLTGTAGWADDRIRVNLKTDATWMEFVGQVVNPTPTISNQFGYLTYLRGVQDLFTGPTQNAQTARFTFFNETTTISVLNHGPLRIVTRLGTTTVYQQAGGADFAHPDSFRAGIPIQRSTLRHVVVVNTTDNSFTTMFENVVTRVSPVETDGLEVELGKVGDMFKITVLGQTVPPIPPNGWLYGFAAGLAHPLQFERQEQREHEGGDGDHDRLHPLREQRQPLAR